MIKARKLLKKIRKKRIRGPQWIASQKDILRRYEKEENTTRINKTAEYYQEILDRDRLPASAKPSRSANLSKKKK